MSKIFARTWLIMVYLFLYFPIVTLVIYSFNDSPLVSIWSQASLRWYRALANDRDLIASVVLSFKIALMVGLLSVLFGTLTAFVLSKYKRFYGRTFFFSMATAPLVMPDVIVGLSLLLMLVSLQHWLGFPERGLLTILLGHALLGTAYAAVVVSSRLKEMDVRLDEAAIAKRRSYKRHDGLWDTEKTAVAFLTDYRSGAIGRISMETPESRRVMMEATLPVVADPVAEISSEVTGEILGDEN